MRHSTFRHALTALFLFSSLTLVQAEPSLTAIDHYVRKPDPSYSWKVIGSASSEGVRSAVIDMISQTWRSADEVNRTKWQHWVTIAYPEKVRSNIGFLYIGGGSNRGEPPTGPSDIIRQIASATGTAVAELRMVPNQPLIFHNDGKGRVEDDLVGYTWDQYIQTGDATWLARNPMVKSAVRAMDTLTAFMASEAGGRQRVDRFVVAGGSKRGWTTWLTGAVDPRVVGIVPIVIDVLNVDVSMRHHFAAYGFWAPSVGNYVQHRIMQRMDHPRLEEIYQLIDPYAYRDRLKMPKLVLNAAGDQFFLPDSSQFYWEDLSGPKCLRYVPNADHGMKGSDAMTSVIAFHSLVIAGRQLPAFSWQHLQDGTLRVIAKYRPQHARLWTATNPLARDFRVETLGRKYTSRDLESDEDGVFEAKVPEPDRGWTAYFIELTYDVGAAVPLKLTTNVRVVPDVLPFKDKDPSLPASLTVVCTAKSEAMAGKVAQAVVARAARGEFPADDLATKVVGKNCYFNWAPASDRFERQAAGLSKFLRDQGCRDVQFQLESGRGITVAPGLALE